MKSLLRKSAYLLLFVFVLALSESLYIVNARRQNLVSVYAAYSARRASKRKDIPKALSSLSWAAQVSIKALPEKYSSLIPQDYQIKLILPDDNDGFENSVANYIESLDLERIAGTEEGNLARVFLDLALISFRNGEEQLAQPLFQTAVYLNPDLSFTHVEYANYYLYRGDLDKAEDEIEYCLKFKDAYNHCQDYKEKVLDVDNPEEPGFTQKELERYYGSLTPKGIF